MSELKISEAVMDLIFSALDEGTESLKSAQGLVPFAILLTKEGFVLRRFADEDIEVAIERAQVAISETDDNTLAYALIYDGQIEVADHSVDALMIEAGERGKEQGWRFVQRYQAKDEKTEFASIGNLAYLGEYDNHLAQDSAE